MHTTTTTSVHRSGAGLWMRALIVTLLGAATLTISAVSPAAGAGTIPATFSAQGPSPITGGQVENMPPLDDVAGAVHTVVTHPSDPDTLWLGATNGGVWRTSNATSPIPTWTPLTDGETSQSIGALELDPTVATNTVLVAGFGRYSSFGRTGGALDGLIRSTDAGSTWTPLGDAPVGVDGGLAGENISGVAARGATIVAASNGSTAFGGAGLGGIFRSTDTGATWNRVTGAGGSGLPGGSGNFDLEGDSSDPTRLYTATQNNLYRSDDTGATWTDITNEVAPTIGATTNNVEITVHNSGGNNVVYAGIINNGQLAGLFRSTNQGGNWTQLDTPTTNEGGTIVGIQPREKPGSQGGVHFSILADLTDPDVVYLGGDRQPVGGGGGWPNSIGATDFSGRLFRCDAGLAAGSQCTPITHNGTASNSSPHADSREMRWDANGDMVEANDGGIVRQTDPATANGDWFSINGTLQISESQSCAYDSVGDLVLCGNQDTGAPEQSASGSSVWNTLSAGDGGFVAVDDSADPSIRYSSSNRLGAGSFLRRSCDAANSCVNSAPGFNVVGQGMTIQQFETDGGGNSTLPLYTPLHMNTVDPSRLIVSSNRLYESTDRLDNLTILSNSFGVITRGVAYGGRAGGADNPSVLWVGQGNGLFLRSAGTGAPVALPAWTFGRANAIVLDPENWARAFIGAGGNVYVTDDAGGSFTDITGDLGSLSTGQVRSLVAVPLPGTDEFAVVAGTDTGVYMTQTQNLGSWAEVGDLPTSIAFNLEYDVADDVLMVGTLGRGVWLLDDFSDVIPQADLRILKSDDPDPVKAGEELFYTVTVVNDGADDAVGVTITDLLPDEIVFLEANGDDCSYDGGAHELVCSIETIPGGSSTSFDIKTLVRSDAVVDEDDGTLLIQNTATVRSVSLDPDLSDNTVTEPTFVQDLADLEVTKLCKPDRDLRAGETGTCTIFVDNLGPSAARDVVMTDTHVSDGPFEFGTITPSQGTCDPPSNGVVRCELGDLAAASVEDEGRATVVIELTADEAVDINDVADATADTPDPDTSNNQAEGSIHVSAVADLSIDKTGPANAIAGTPITFTISIANDGPSTAEDVVVEDAVPAGVSMISVSGSNGAGCNAGTPGDPTDPASCSFGSLAPGAARTMTVEVFVLPDTRGVIHDDARVTSATFDDDTSDNLDTLATEVTGSADLSITKAGSPDPVTAGDPLTYTIIVGNDGPSTAFDVTITDTIPAGTTFVDGEDGNGTTVCTLVQVGDVVCDLGDIAPGGSVTVYLTVDTDPSLDPGAVLTNQATVDSITPDPDPSDNTAIDDTDVVTSADVWLDKTGEMRSGNPAPVIIYTLVVHNDAGCETDAQSEPSPTCGDGGPSDARDIVVVDQLPANSQKLVVQYVSPQCTYDAAAHTVTCTAENVPAGATVSFVIEAQANGSLRLITNTATVSTSTSDPVLENNTDSVDIVVKGGTGTGGGGGGGGGGKGNGKGPK